MEPKKETVKQKEELEAEMDMLRRNNSCFGRCTKDSNG